MNSYLRTIKNFATLELHEAGMGSHSKFSIAIAAAAGEGEAHSGNQEKSMKTAGLTHFWFWQGNVLHTHTLYSINSFL